MAYITNIDMPRFGQRFLEGTAGFFRAFGTAMTISAQSETRMREIQRLQGKTDSELAELGLTRDRIVHHVFRDIYYM